MSDSIDLEPIPEEVLWEGRPSYWNWVGQAVLALLFGAGAWAAAGQGHRPLSMVAGAGAAALGLRILMHRRRRLYQLTNQRVIAHTGVLSKHVSEVELGDIRSISLEQSFFQRLFGMGDVGISSSAGEGVEVAFADVARPAEVKERVRHARLGGLKTRGE